MIELRHKARECIGCAQCAEIAPLYWKMNTEGMAKLTHITRSNDILDFGEGFEDDLQALQEAEAACPVSIIQVCPKKRVQP